MLKLATRKLLKEVGDRAARIVAGSTNRDEARKRLRQLRIALTYGKRPAEVAAINLVIDLFRDVVEKLDPTYVDEWWSAVQQRFHEQDEDISKIDPDELRKGLPEYAVAPNVELRSTWQKYVIAPHEEVDAYFIRQGDKYVVNPRVRQAFRHFKKKFNLDIGRLYMEAPNMGNLLGFFFVDKKTPTVVMSPMQGASFLQTLFHELVHATSPTSLYQLQTHPRVSDVEKDKVRLIQEIAAEATTRAFHNWVTENYTPGVVAAIANGILPVPDTPKWKRFVRENNIQINPPAIVRHPVEILAGDNEHIPLVEELSKYKNIGTFRKGWYKLLDMWWAISKPSIYSKAAAMTGQNQPLSQLRPTIDKPPATRGSALLDPSQGQNKELDRFIAIIRSVKALLHRLTASNVAESTTQHTTV